MSLPTLNARLACTGIFLGVAAFTAIATFGQAPNSESKPNVAGSDELLKRVEALEVATSLHQSTISSLSQFNPPIGSVLAFAGEWPPIKPDGSKWKEEELGWMLCDGRALSSPNFDALPSVIRNAGKLPDYRGYFLRGVARGQEIDPDRDSRVGGDNVGSTQSWATGLPHTDFVTNETGAHVHELSNSVNVGSSPDQAGAEITTFERSFVKAGMKPAGDHKHTVAFGGDNETRPVNVAVHWIIKTGAPQ